MSPLSHQPARQLVVMLADRKRSDCLWGLRAYNLQPDSIPGNYRIVMEILSCQYTESMELTIILTFLLCFDSWWEKSFTNIFNIGEIVDRQPPNEFPFEIWKIILIYAGKAYINSCREDNAGLYLIREIVLCSVYPHRLLMTVAALRITAQTPGPCIEWEHDTATLPASS